VNGFSLLIGFIMSDDVVKVDPRKSNISIPKSCDGILEGSWENPPSSASQSEVQFLLRCLNNLRLFPEYSCAKNRFNSIILENAL